MLLTMTVFHNNHSEHTFNKHNSLWFVRHILKWRRKDSLGLTSVQVCSIHRYTVQDKTGTVIRIINFENGREISPRAVIIFGEECIINADIKDLFWAFI